MVSQAFEKSGWLNRYLSYRAENPFILSEQYLNLEKGNNDEKIFDECLYKEVKENGILLGCPVITRSLSEMKEKLDLPNQRGGTVLLYIETMFSIAMVEYKILNSISNNDSSESYQIRLLNILLLVLKYHFPHSYYRIPREVPLTKLLKHNESLNGVLIQLEEVLIGSVTLPGYSSLGNRQNIFAFSKLYFFLLWARGTIKRDFSSLNKYIEMDKKLREEMITAFAALIWADDFIASAEEQVFEKYIEQTGLEESIKNELGKRILEPVKTADFKFSFSCLNIRRYLVEQLILLSFINNQEAWQERDLIENISQKLGFSLDELEELYFTVAEFFSVHSERLEFLKNNAAAKQFQDYMNDKVFFLVKKNLGNIMKEIEETKELSELLVKATKKSLTMEEKQKVQDQLMDIAKTIPALAIFVLPGGGILLPILIKVLPFNILPSSFQEEKASR
ncbi:MAG: hypothetical protein CL935_04110 [Deltaproteobacteria bacterium]|nr:hypothetical protein [Deltaproteobacteria bacterium]